MAAPAQKECSPYSQVEGEERGGFGRGELFPGDHLEQLPVDLPLSLPNSLQGNNQKPLNQHDFNQKHCDGEKIHGETEILVAETEILVAEGCLGGLKNSSLLKPSLSMSVGRAMRFHLLGRADEAPGRFLGAAAAP